MKVRGWLAVGLLTLAGAAVALRCFLTVDETEFVIVTEFGRVARIYGDQLGESGLHGKLPWQQALRVDRRIQVSEAPAREIITGDKRNLEITPYTAWRVADPLRFVQAAATLEAAGDRIEERVTSALGTALGGVALADLVGQPRGGSRLDGLTTGVLESLAPRALDELGVELLDLRLARFNYPLEVRPAIFELIRSERRKEAAALRAEGEADYEVIVSEANRDRSVALAKADAEAARIRAEGEAEAMRILNAAHGRDPAFYTFLRTLETYESLLDARATLVISASSPLLKLLREGPGLNAIDAEVPSAADTRPASAELGSRALEHAGEPRPCR
jgi:membrane protease subunit HflC